MLQDQITFSEIPPHPFRFFIILLNYSWLVVLRIYVASAVFQPYRDLDAGDNQSLKIQVARRGIEPRTSCSASQELITTRPPPLLLNYKNTHTMTKIPLHVTTRTKNGQLSKTAGCSIIYIYHINEHFIS